MTDIPMRITLQAIGGQGVISSISGIGKSLGSSGLSGALLGVGVAAAGTAIALGGIAVKAASGFQSQLTSLSTGAGESTKNLGMVSSGILNLATSTGTTTKLLTDGMYQIESAGYHGADGLNVLKAAAMGAKVGNADLGTVSNATTTIMTDFGIKSSNASTAVNTLIATVSNGKTTMQALSGSLSQILPTASAAKIGLTDTMAAMATMTGEGVPAANAATYLRQTIMALTAPSKQTQDALTGIGLSSKDVSSEMQKSLPGALQMITDALSKKFKPGSADYIAALQNIAGGSKQMQGILDLTGQHLQTFKGNVDNISGSVTKGGSSINGWAQVQQNFNFKMQQGQEVLETLGIRVGSALLPVITQLMGKLTPIISNFSDWLIKSGALQNGINTLITTFTTLVTTGSNIVNFFKNNQLAMDGLKAVLVGLGAGILVFAAVSLPPLIAAFGAWAIAAAAAAIATLAAAAPFILIGVVVAAVVFGIIEAIQHWGAISAWLQGVWSATLNFIKGLWGGLGAWFQGIWTSIQGAFSSVGSWFSQQFTNAKNGVTSAFGNIGGWFTDRYHDIQNTFSNVGGWFQQKFSDAKTGAQNGWSGVNSFFQNSGTALKTIWTNTVNGVVQTFSWLYNHNYYFKNLVDNIQAWMLALGTWMISTWNNLVSTVAGLWSRLTGFASSTFNSVSSTICSVISAIVSWVQSTWSNGVNFVSSQWSRLTGFAGSIFNQVSGTIRAVIAAIISWIQGQWNSAVAYVSGQWNRLIGLASSIFNSVSATISGIVANILSWFQGQLSRMGGLAQTAWNGVSGVFRGAWGSISGALSGLYSNISNWFSGLASDALSWGSNIIGSVISGIQGAAGGVGSAINNAIGGALSGLGFHGLPGHAEGILNSAVGHWAIVGEKGPEMMYVPAGSSIFPNSFSGFANQNQSGGSSGGGTYTITYNNTFNIQPQNLDASNVTQLTQQIAVELGEQLRAQYGNI